MKLNFKVSVKKSISISFRVERRYKLKEYYVAKRLNDNASMRVATSKITPADTGDTTIPTLWMSVLHTSEFEGALIFFALTEIVKGRIHTSLQADCEIDRKKDG